MRSEPSKTYDGLFYDGESAKAHEAVVRCSTTVIVVSEGANVLATWSYADLISPDPLSAGRRARLTHVSAPYARLVVEDRGFSECVLDRAPQLSKRAHNLQTLKLVMGCMAVAAVFAGIAFLLLTFAPRTVASVMPDEWRLSLGNQVIKTLVGKRKLCTGPAGLHALEAMRKRISAHEANPGQFQVLVYDLAIVNAFALPGGLIVISGKLIEAASGPEGVAGVLAHEMGHVIERDSETQLVRAMGISLLQQVMLGGGQISDSIGGVAGLLALLTYTREAERRADVHAQRIMQATGVQPDGLIKFFEFVKDKYGSKSDDDDGGSLLNLFSTHPGLDERIGKLKALPKWPSTPVINQTQWTDLKSICSSGTPKEEKKSPDSTTNG